MMTKPHVWPHRTILASSLLTIFISLVPGPREVLPQEPAQRFNQLPELILGVPVSPTIAVGEAQSFRITLAAGQFVLVAVEPQRIDLSMKLFSSDGRLLAEADRDHRD